MKEQKEESAQRCLRMVMGKYIDRVALFNSLSDAKTVEEIFAAIQAAPAEDVEPARHWIPVSWENLPEDENKVLCCTVTAKGTKGIVLGYYSRELERWVCGMNSNVIAWMPLPDPPRFDRVIDVFEKPDERVAVEGYRLTLTHFMDCRDGERNLIEDPLTVQTFYDRSSRMPASYCVNEMLERLKHEILRRI